MATLRWSTQMVNAFLRQEIRLVSDRCSILVTPKTPSPLRVKLRRSPFWKHLFTFFHLATFMIHMSITLCATTRDTGMFISLVGRRTTKRLDMPLKNLYTFDLIIPTVK